MLVALHRPRVAGLAAPPSACPPEKPPAPAPAVPYPHPFPPFQTRAVCLAFPRGWCRSSTRLRYCQHSRPPAKKPPCTAFSTFWSQFSYPHHTSELSFLARHSRSCVPHHSSSVQKPKRGRLTSGIAPFKNVLAEPAEAARIDQESAPDWFSAFHPRNKPLAPRKPAFFLLLNQFVLVVLSLGVSGIMPRNHPIPAWTIVFSRLCSDARRTLFDTHPSRGRNALP
jgi:hypothetical protein